MLTIEITVISHSYLTDRLENIANSVVFLGFSAICYSVLHNSL